MSEQGKVHPDCVNASNPYHVCMEECYMKIANGKPRKSKPQSGSWTAADRHSNTMPKERRVNRSCPNASNPYHECGEFCSQKVARAQPRTYKKEPGSTEVDAPQSMSRRKNRGQNPQVNSSDVPSNITSPVVSARTPLSSHLAAEKELEDNHVSSPIPYSGEIHPEDFSFLNGQVKSSHSVPTSGNATPMLVLSPDRAKDPSKENFTYVANSISSKEIIEEKEIVEEKSHDPPPHRAVPSTAMDDATEGIQRSARGSMSSTLSDVAHSAADTDEEDDVQSVMSESRVSVGKYHVKSSLSSILQAILEKYGDIAENCVLESISIRSYYVECVCYMVQELQYNSFLHLTKSKVKEMSAILKDLESSHVNVSWLRKILDELSEVIEVITQHQAVRSAKNKCDHGLLSMQKMLEYHINDIAKKEEELAEAKAKLAETRNRLRELELESSKLNESVSSLASEIDSFHFKSLLEELL